MYVLLVMFILWPISTLIAELIYNHNLKRWIKREGYVPFGEDGPDYSDPFFITYGVLLTISFIIYMVILSIN